MPKSTKSRQVRNQNIATAGPIQPAPMIEDMTDQDAANDERVEAAFDQDLLEIEAQVGTTCACGCGCDVAPKRLFRQGHDQRLIGILARAAINKHEIGLNDGTMLVVMSSQQYGARVLTEFGQIKLGTAIDRATERRANNKKDLGVTPMGTILIPSTEANRAPLIQQTEHEHNHEVCKVQSGDEVKVRIGRHVYYARVHGMNQAGKVTAVRYITKAKPDEEKITEKFTIVD